MSKIIDKITGQYCKVSDVNNEMGYTVFIITLPDGTTARRKCGEICVENEGGDTDE
jgi:hypothetical protein